jgi:hypothetical protein
MYAEDVPVIAQHGLASPDGLVDVIAFVLLTIQQPLRGVRAQFADVKKRGRKSRFLFGAKRDGFDYVQSFKNPLFKRVSAAIENGDTAAGIDALLEVPSLGLVKAAFVMQLLGAPDAACVDTHNGTGPYRQTFPGMSRDYLSYTARHPRPPMTMYDDGYLFGFRNKAQFEAWFNERERTILARHGFKLTKWRVPKDAIQEDARQIAFEKDKAYRVSAVNLI